MVTGSTPEPRQRRPTTDLPYGPTEAEDYCPDLDCYRAAGHDGPHSIDTAEPPSA